MKKTILFLLSLCFISMMVACQTVDKISLEALSETITFDEIIYENLYLPNQIDDVIVTWQSSNEAYLSSDGIITRPSFELGDQTVSLKATFSRGEAVFEKTFSLMIPKLAKTAQTILTETLHGIVLPDTISQSITLESNINGVALTYQSSNPNYLTSDGTLLKRPSFYDEDILISLTIIGLLDGVEFTESRVIRIEKAPFEMPVSVIGYASVGFDLNFPTSGDNYYVVTNELEFIQALSQKNDQAALVIELRQDLDLGYHHVLEKYPNITFDSNVFRAHNTALTHPVLKVSGVSRVQIRDRKAGTSYQKGIKIFSPFGNKIKHATFFIKNSENVWIDNLELDEIWEYDDSLNYDRNDWDYVTVEDSKNVWLNNLTLHQAYDGLIDIKGASSYVSITNSRFLGQKSAFIDQQVAYLETNRTAFPTYNLYREKGLTVEDMKTLLSFQKKGHLIGSSELAPNNAYFTVTLAYNYYENVLDRIPRLRGGDVHVYNIIHDAKAAYAFRLKVEPLGVRFTNQGLVTTENGAVLMENSIFIGVSTPIKNNQKDESTLYTGKY
ncbi:MAG: hypothetical protein CVV63_01665, partial [Tenericutes bacterium HGW-Tenericutes-8]